MFFASLPAWANLVILAIALIAKYFILDCAERSQSYLDTIAKHGWMATLNIVAGLNAVITAVFVLLFAGVHWAIVLGVGDFALHWLLGYWKLKKMLPHIDDGNVQQAEDWLAKAWKWFAAIHTASYVSLATYVVDFINKHPQLAQKALQVIHFGGG